MELTLAQLEQSIGGRPAVKAKKKRVGVYLQPDEIQALKTQAERKDMAVSEIVRVLIRKHLINTTV